MTSSFRDSDYSDDSFDESSTSSSMLDDPPTLDETLFDIRLYLMFNNYMVSQQLGGNLQFLKQARLFRMLRMPREVIVQQAVQIIWTYFSDCAPSPVFVSPETKKNLMEMALDPEAEVGIDKDMFSVAFEQVYNVVVPHFRNWLSTKEWREAIPFHRLAPPTFSIVLSSKALRFLFNKYLKAQVEHGGDESSARAYHMWKFCLMANDFREGKLTHLSHLEPKKKKKSKDDESTDVPTEKEKSASKEEVSEKPIDPEEYAKRIYKKYKRHISLMYDGSIPHAVFVVRALDQVIEEFDRSTLFQRWLALKQYYGVDFQAKVVHQTLTPEGFVEPPTLAGAMTSGMLPFFLVLTAGTEAGANLEFLVDVLRFRRVYDNGSTSSASGTGTGGSGSGSQKDMVEEARRIFTKYLDSGIMYCDPELVEEVHSTLKKKSGKGMSCRIFRKCGAFIYQRSEHTWCREARATIAWANKSYDNNSKSARAVEEEFSMSVLPEGIDLHILPTIDDAYANRVLLDDYKQAAGPEVCSALERYRDLYMEYFTLPVNQRKKQVEKLVGVFGELATFFPEIQPMHNVLVKETSKRERVSDSVLVFALVAIVRAGSKIYYPKWLVERASFWKKAEWTPVKTVMFSDLSSVVGAQVIDKKIREEALKGKSGIARYMAIRQVKKQSSGSIHANSVKGSGSSSTVFTTIKASSLMSRSEADAKKLKESSPLKVSSSDMVIPTIVETLSSSYLRRYFDNTFLCGFISSAEHQLWESLQQFFEKYSTMDSKNLFESQDEMRKTIGEICDKFKHLLKNADELKQSAEKDKVIFPQFFREVEIELYTEAHGKFEKVLLEKGWK